MGYWSIVNTASGAAVTLDSLGAYVTAYSGAGMPTPRNVASEYGIIDGAYYQRTVIPPRVVTLTLTAFGTSLANLHSIRQSLIDLIKPDRVAVQQVLELRYNRGAKSLRLLVVYDGGLEVGGAFAGFTETMTLRFVAYNPYFELTTTNSQSLTVNTASVTGGSVLRRNATTGAWTRLGTLAAASDLLVDGSGTIYACNTNGVYSYNSGTDTWTLLGASASTTALRLAPNGTIYAIRAGEVAYWTGSAWTVVSSYSGTVTALAIDAYGVVYAGRSGGQVHSYNGSSWSGTYGSALSGQINAIAFSASNTIYIGGAFTEQVASWNGSAWVAVGSYPASGGIKVRSLLFGLDGTLYAGRDAGAGPDVAIYAWNGSSWTAPGGGISGYSPGCADLVLSPTGVVVAVGYFLGLGSATPLVTYGGGTWLYGDIQNFTLNSLTAVTFVGNDVVVGVGTSGTAHGITNITSVTNSGSAAALPTITCSCTMFTTAGNPLFQIANVTTGDYLYFTARILNSEIWTIDLSQRTFTSNLRGNMIQYLSPGSNLATWRLIPGVNSISTFANVSSGTVTASLTWRERYWSVDA